MRVLRSYLKIFIYPVIGIWVLLGMLEHRINKLIEDYLFKREE